MRAWWVQRIDTRHLQLFGCKFFFGCVLFDFYRLHEECELSLIWPAGWLHLVAHGSGRLRMRQTRQPLQCIMLLALVQLYIMVSNYFTNACRRNDCEHCAYVDEEAYECVFTGEAPSPVSFFSELLVWNGLCEERVPEDGHSADHGGQ